MFCSVYWMCPSAQKRKNVLPDPSIHPSVRSLEWLLYVAIVVVALTGMVQWVDSEAAAAPTLVGSSIHPSFTFCHVVPLGISVSVLE